MIDLSEGQRVTVRGCPGTVDAVVERLDGSPAVMVRMDGGGIGIFYDADGLEDLFGVDLIQVTE